MAEVKEKMMEKVLRLRDEGKSKREIVKLFPSDEEEVIDALDILSWIEQEKEDIIVPKADFTAMLSQIKDAPEEISSLNNAFAPKKQSNPFSKSKEEPFVPLHPQPKKSFLFKFTGFGHVWTGAGVLAAILLLVLFSKTSMKDQGINPSLHVSEIETVNKNTALGASTVQDANDILLALQKNSDSEVTIFSDINNDSAGIDAQVDLANFSEIFNENGI